MHNYDANMNAGVSRGIKRWQRAFLGLYGLKVDWPISTNESLLLYNLLRYSWRMPRQGTPAQWQAIYKLTDQGPVRRPPRGVTLHDPL